MLLKSRIFMTVIFVFMAVQSVCLAAVYQAQFNKATENTIAERVSGYVPIQKTTISSYLGVNAAKSGVASVVNSYAHFNAVKAEQADVATAKQPKIDIGHAYFTHNTPVIQSLNTNSHRDQIQPYLGDPKWTVTVTNSGFKVSQKLTGDSKFIVDRDIAGTIGASTYARLKPFLDDPTWTVTATNFGYKVYQESTGESTFIVDKNMLMRNESLTGFLNK